LAGSIVGALQDFHGISGFDGFGETIILHAVWALPVDYCGYPTDRLGIGATRVAFSTASDAGALVLDVYAHAVGLLLGSLRPRHTLTPFTIEEPYG